MKYITCILATLLILIAVLIPGAHLPDVGHFGIDKLAHFILFFIWAVGVRRDFSSSFRWVACLIAGIAFSVLTEVMQIYVEDRTFDPIDMFADVAGLACGIAMGATLLRWIGRFVRL